MPCKTKCNRCLCRVDRYSGKLVNLSDYCLEQFYKIPMIKEAISIHKHPSLCSTCLEHELGRSLTGLDLKFKDGKWMTSNVIFILSRFQLISEDRIKFIESIDKSGVLPYKRGDSDILAKDLNLSVNIFNKF